MNNILTTNTGVQLNLVNVTPDMFNIKDIAHGLSMICRFNGQIPRFYSVAQHSCLVHDQLLKTNDPLLCLAALLHDASEAYICDIPTPLKDLLPEYRVIEDQVMHAIALKFGISNYRHYSNIKDADKLVFELEWRSFKHGYNTIVCWDQTVAYHEFLSRFYNAMNSIGKCGYDVKNTVCHCDDCRALGNSCPIN